MQKFDLFVPFGSICMASWNLRKNGLQTESMPYDWIGPANLDTELGFLENGFAGLIEKDKLEYFGRKDHEAHFRMPNGVTFQHDFTKENLEEYPKVEAKYQRRIKRLYEKLTRARSVMFVHFDYDYPKEEELKDAVSRLKKLYPQKRIRLLYVALDEALQGWRLETENEDYTLAVLEFDKDGSWVGNMPLIREIFSPYKLTLRAKLEKIFVTLFHKRK